MKILHLQTLGLIDLFKKMYRDTKYIFTPCGMTSWLPWRQDKKHCAE